MPYDKLPLAARLNIDADFLATRYREHGRLRASSKLDHRFDQQISLYINGTPVTSQFDECIRYHVNGYHHRNYVQQHHGWDNNTWNDIDFIPSAVTSNVFLLHTGANTLNSFMTNFLSAIVDFARPLSETRH